MPLREIFNRKYNVRLKVRLEVLGDVLREWFYNWWLLVFSIVLLGLGLWLAWGFQLVSIESARWTLSALIQAGAALIGIFYVALGLLWTQANQEAERLRILRGDYMDEISPSRGTNLGSFISLLVESARTVKTQNQEARNKLRDCFIRLIALSDVEIQYQNVSAIESPTVSFRKMIGLHTGIIFTKEEDSRIQSDRIRISIDTMAFFRYLESLESDVDSAIRLNAFEMSAGYKIRKSEFYTNVLHKARRQDRIYISLWKLRFINYFKGKGIVIISALWLTCLVLGLFTLFALDKIPINILPYIASLPLAIGVIAIGTTLAFGFQAMSVKE